MHKSHHCESANKHAKRQTISISLSCTINTARVRQVPDLLCDLKQRVCKEWRCAWGCWYFLLCCCGERRSARDSQQLWLWLLRWCMSRCGSMCGILQRWLGLGCFRYNQRHGVEVGLVAPPTTFVLLVLVVLPRSIRVGCERQRTLAQRISWKEASGDGRRRSNCSGRSDRRRGQFCGSTAYERHARRRGRHPF